MSAQKNITITADQVGKRLDKILADTLPDLSRSRLQALIKDGAVLSITDDTPTAVKNPAQRGKADDRYRVVIPEPADPTPLPQKLPLDIVYEDEHLLVVNKAAGMVVHPAAGAPDKTLVNALLHHAAGSLSGIGGVKRPGIVHRIDKDTSGVLVVAKNDKAHNHLSAQFAEHSVQRRYIALIRGAITPFAGTIEGNIGRHPKDRKKMAVVGAGRGRSARTHYKTLAQFTSGGQRVASIVAARLETGRTHQVRVHMTHKNAPLIGDPVYGRANRLPHGVSAKARAAIQSFKRQALHAQILGFKHPITDAPLYFEQALPNDMEALILALEGACTKHSA